MNPRYALALFLVSAVLVAAASAEEKPKFSLGMHDPGAQWVREGTWAGIGVQGYLDGPRLSTRSGSGPSPGGWFDDGARCGGRFIYREYDKETECVRTAIGSTRGYLDGPFTRARFGGWGYVHGLKAAHSSDRRYIWFIDHYSGGVLRRIDWEKEEVVTISREVVDLKAMTADKEGNLYLAKTGAAVIMDTNGQTRTVKLEVPDGKMYSHGFTVSLDGVHNRLYGMNRNGPNGWYVWYWDMSADGKFTGVLPSPSLDPKAKTRPLNATGPFNGCKLHCPSGFSFGGHTDVHNPQRRWAYLGGGDNTTFYRLDLEKQVFDTFGPVDITQKTPYRDLAFVHVNKKLPTGSVVKWAGPPGLDEEGNIYLKIGVWPETIRFKRVK